MTNDQTKAVALQLAFATLDKLGWKYSFEDIGRKAAEIIKAMNKELGE